MGRRVTRRSCLVQHGIQLVSQGIKHGADVIQNVLGRGCCGAASRESLNEMGHGPAAMAVLSDGKHLVPHSYYLQPPHNRSFRPSLTGEFRGSGTKDWAKGISDSPQESGNLCRAP